ncbi:unnamed protein product [Rotaria sordida]|uniref:Uncharacterized protein n=1 Tax=Rotaria sordida TaxID=392033 RepID=A0A819DAE2_9BILA|nr:unnamed protein product [Rotaria sordida]
MAIATPGKKIFDIPMTAAKTTTATEIATTIAITAATTTTTTANTATMASTTTGTTITGSPTGAITRAYDPTVGICNSIAGGSTGGSDNNYPITENPYNAIDGNINTKYLNFGDGSTGCYGSAPPGINTGFYVTPTISNATVAIGLLFATSNDFPTRDPTMVTLEGTNETSTAALNSGASWTLIYNGSTGIDSYIDSNRLTYVSRQNFSNTMAFSSYRLLVTAKRGVSNSVQYAEAHIMGYIYNS